MYGFHMKTRKHHRTHVCREAVGLGGLRTHGRQCTKVQPRQEASWQAGWRQAQKRPGWNPQEKGGPSGPVGKDQQKLRCSWGVWGTSHRQPRPPARSLWFLGACPPELRGCSRGPLWTPPPAARHLSLVPKEVQMLSKVEKPFCTTKSNVNTQKLGSSLGRSPRTPAPFPDPLQGLHLATLESLLYTTWPSSQDVRRPSPGSWPGAQSAHVIPAQSAADHGVESSSGLPRQPKAQGTGSLQTPPQMHRQGSWGHRSQAPRTVPKKTTSRRDVQP